MATDIFERGNISGTACVNKCSGCNARTLEGAGRMVQISETLTDKTRCDRIGFFNYVIICRQCLADLLAALVKD